MPDLQNQPPTPDNPGGPDPLSSLYKMSRTAGLGTTEYVAINGAAVTAAILGLASALAVMADVLLVIPLVGIVFGIVALRQISHSSGTQGGRALAWAGLVLCLGFAGLVIGGEVRETLIHRTDTKEIVAVIDQFSDAAKAGDVDRAYALFAPQFQARVDKEQRFAGLMKSLRKSQVQGDLEYVRWNGVRMQFESVPNQPDRYASGAMLVKFVNGNDPLRTELVFRNAGEGWKIYNIPSFFPEQQAAAKNQPQRQ